MADPHMHITQISSSDDQPSEPTVHQFKNKHLKNPKGPDTEKEKPHLLRRIARLVSRKRRTKGQSIVQERQGTCNRDFGLKSGGVSSDREVYKLLGHSQTLGEALLSTEIATATLRHITFKLDDQTCDPTVRGFKNRREIIHLEEPEELFTQISSSDYQPSEPTVHRFRNIGKIEHLKKPEEHIVSLSDSDDEEYTGMLGMNFEHIMSSSDSDDEEYMRKMEHIVSLSDSDDEEYTGMLGMNFEWLRKKRWLEDLSVVTSVFSRTPHGMTESQKIHQYKLSIIQKYESEWSSLTGEKESVSSLYNEPFLIEKNENGPFKNISVDGLFWSFDSVILQGDSGSDKSFIAQRIMLNWAFEELSASHFNLIFYLSCEELMCISEEFNLFKLLSYSCSLTSDEISQVLQQSPEKVLFIIDGFDELRLTQDVYDMSANTDPLQKAPPEVILCGLMRGYLIPESKLLVTTRTRNTVNKLLKGQPCFTEIMGFSEKKVEMYFQKFFSKEYDCVRGNETLLTSCSVPVTCRMISEMFKVGADVTSGLETTTSIYVDFVSTLLEHHCQGLSQSVSSLLRSLGQLAERGMLEQQVLFDEKTVNETISDPDGNPFLCKFLSKRRIHQETMFSFMHISFQEFFTALYYVLLNEEESQQKVRELLHTVERGWALSCWPHKELSMADVEITHAKLLQPVILFLCGFCKKEWIPSFFEKHNMAVSVNIETQLKEWINQCSQRYQNEHMLFILHCLYELQEKSFVGKALDGLVLIDLSDIPLKRTDCWVLKYSLQCYEHIRNLKLHVTSGNLKMLQPELYRCKELWLSMNRISDDVVGLVSAAAEGKILNKLNNKFEILRSGLREITVSVRDGDITLSFSTSDFTSSTTELTLTSPCSFISTINWVKSQLYCYRYLHFKQNRLLTFLQSVSGLKKVCLQDSHLTKAFASEILSFIQACPSLNELSINAEHQFMLREIPSIKTSLEKIGWTLTIWGKLALIKPYMERFTEEKLKTKQEKIGESSDSALKDETSAYSDLRRLSEGTLKFQGTQHSQFWKTGYQATVHQYKLSIKQKYESEWSSLSDERKSLSALYNEPVIIQKNENGSFKNVSVDGLFQSYGKTVILQGDSGSGKSVIAQKIMLDWANKEFISHILFNVVFYLRCEELMCVSEKVNLIEVLSCSCSLTFHQISQILQQSPWKVLFIIDGFDELRLTQDIFDTSANTDPLQKFPPEVILCGLMRGYLIPESQLLVTTKTRNIVNKLLKGQPCFTEIMGFSEKKVETYFQKFFSKEYDCVRANETLLTSCSIPVICWIISEMFKVGENVTSGLETTTSIYVDFVSTLLEHHCQGLSQSVSSLLRSLGQLAERGMLEQQVLFDEKSVNETISDPDGNLFLCKVLSKKRICQETMFSFMYHNFQEFFTTLYYVLLDEEESQSKVKELLQIVERGWALSCWPHRDFSMADIEVRHAKLLQPVILFLCGFCEKEWIPSFTEKHNMAVSVNIETQLKEWISTCSQRYQNEHMLFILHCLYELHEKSFVEKVLDSLHLLDLSDTPLKTTDCWVLKYCLQCCKHIRNMKLHVTPDNLKMLQPELYCCKELWLIMDHISDDIVGLVSVAAEGKILNKLNIKKIENYRRLSTFRPEITVSVRDGDIMLSFSQSEFTSSATDITLTSPRSVISTINKLELYIYGYLSSEEKEVDVRLLTFLGSVSGLKKVSLQASLDLTITFASEILSFIKACTSLIEISIKVRDQFMLKEIAYLKESLKKICWTLTVWGKLVWIKPHPRTEELKTKIEKSENKIEESSDSVSCSSLKAQSSAHSFSDDVEVFTPELRRYEDKHKNAYKFVCPHAGQFRCSVTNVVFVMKGGGEVLYNIDSWDPRLLDGLGQMQPAGPLYNIDCSAKSVSGLHLPHCVIFSEEIKDGLAVVHFTGGNVEIIQPLKVTQTHVMVDITDLSGFGLWIRSKLSPQIDGQVLLFLRTLTLEYEEKILNVHLLPGNVPVSEVQLKHHDKTYIETSSQCCLFPEREYSLCCQQEKCVVQPMSQMFKLNFGPNYHPTFEVFLDVEINDVGLSILDKSKKGKEVWQRQRIPLTAPSKSVEPPAQTRIPAEAEFVNTHKDKLIQRVSSVMPIADSLEINKVITYEIYKEIKAAKTSQQQMRALLDALESGGDKAKVKFCRLLKEKEPLLIGDLAPHLCTDVQI